METKLNFLIQSHNHLDISGYLKHKSIFIGVNFDFIFFL